MSSRTNFGVTPFLSCAGTQVMSLSGFLPALISIIWQLTGLWTTHNVVTSGFSEIGFLVIIWAWLNTSPWSIPLFLYRFHLSNHWTSGPFINSEKINGILGVTPRTNCNCGERWYRGFGFWYFYTQDTIFDFYSLFKASTGFLLAALYHWQKMVRIRKNKRED